MKWGEQESAGLADLCYSIRDYTTKQDFRQFAAGFPILPIREFLIFTGSGARFS